MCMSPFEVDGKLILGACDYCDKFLPLKNKEHGVCKLKKQNKDLNDDTDLNTIGEAMTTNYDSCCRQLSCKAPTCYSCEFFSFIDRDGDNWFVGRCGKGGQPRFTTCFHTNSCWTSPYAED